MNALLFAHSGAARRFMLSEIDRVQEATNCNKWIISENCLVSRCIILARCGIQRVIIKTTSIANSHYHIVIKIYC